MTNPTTVIPSINTSKGEHLPFQPSKSPRHKNTQNTKSKHMNDDLKMLWLKTQYNPNESDHPPKNPNKIAWPTAKHAHAADK